MKIAMKKNQYIYIYIYIYIQSPENVFQNSVKLSPKMQEMAFQNAGMAFQISNGSLYLKMFHGHAPDPRRRFSHLRCSPQFSHPVALPLPIKCCMSFCP